jgi:hypothetical protein
LPNRNAVLFGQALGELSESRCVGALNDGKRFRALLGLAPIRDDPNQHVARGGDSPVCCWSRVRYAGRVMALEGTIDVAEVRLVAPFDGIQRVMDGEVHHRHGPADDNVVLAAGGGRIGAAVWTKFMVPLLLGPRKE